MNTQTTYKLLLARKQAFGPIQKRHRGRRKLTDAQVAQVKREHAAGATAASLAQFHCVSKSLINAIVSGRDRNVKRSQ